VYGDRLKILILHVTFNVHYFFFVLLGLVLSSLRYPALDEYPAEIMLVFVKTTRINLDFLYSVEEFSRYIQHTPKN
jgi:hypothetical protein